MRLPGSAGRANTIAAALTELTEHCALRAALMGRCFWDAFTLYASHSGHDRV